MADSDSGSLVAEGGMDGGAPRVGTGGGSLLAEDGAERVLAGGGEMGARMRALDWAATPVGPVGTWPQSLRTAVSICLASRFPMLIWWGPELVMLYNDAYRQILGATKHPRAMGQRGRECWPEIWDVIGPMLGGVLSRGEATWSDDQLLLLDRNGYVEECYFTFSYSPIRDETGGVGGVFTAVTETTGRVLGERRLATLRELAASAATARSVEDACAFAAAALARSRADVPFALLYLLDADGRVAHLAAMSGLNGDVPAHLSQVDLVAGDTPLARAAHANVAEIVDGLGAHFGRLPCDSAIPPHAALVLPVAQAGQERVAGLLVAGISPRRALDDEYRGFFALVAGQIAAAIANARAHEEEHRRAEVLAELDRAKTTFFSNVSHEFRTPLTLLLGPLEEALAVPPDTPAEATRPALETAHRNSLRLLRLVNTLLDFSRIEAGRAEATYEPTDLAVLTADLAGTFRSAVERAGLQLIVDCPPLPDPVYIDHEMWEKVVLNLLSNAFKFTFEGHILVCVRHAGDRVELEIRDTGVGVPATELPHLFERFYRFRGTRARTHEGSGIGLALVRELVALHGGTIRVASEVDSGTTVTVALPLGAAHLPAERVGATRTMASTALGARPYVEEARHWLPDAEATAGVTGTMMPTGASPAGGATPLAAASPAARVLLADDNADMRAYVARLLGARYAVEAVSDGAAALAAAQARPPNLVLADVMMPGLDGFALLRELRADPRTATLPVILLSARAGEDAHVEGLDAGADDYLVKPFAARDLLARVAAHLELARLRQGARDALAVERDRLRQVVELLPAAVVVADAALTIQVSNRVRRALVGLDTAANRPPDVGETVPRDDAAFFAAYGARHLDRTPYTAAELPLARAVLRGEEVHGEQMLVRNAVDGREVPILVNATPLRDEVGAITGGAAVFQDITALKDLEQAREDFLSSAAHDLKTPLTSIQALAQLAERRLTRGAATETEAIGQFLTQIVGATRQMVGLINELVDLSRAQAGGQLELRRQATDLVALARAVVAQQQTAAPQRIGVEAADPELVIPIDVERMERALANLLANAIKYSPGDGDITVRVQREVDERGTWAAIAVRDHGIGIPAADLPHIFERFHRGSNVAGQIQGTGIGLASARHIAEQHGGAIVVESQEGAGSTFTLRLPLSG